MKTLIRLSPAFLLVLAAAGCSPTADPLGGPRPTDKTPVHEEKKSSLFAKNIFIETKGNKRYVEITATVAHQEQQFCEFFLCRKDTKEYESVLVADVEPSKVHAALLAAGAEPGSPVQYEPTFQPPKGTAIKVTLVWQEKGLEKKASAQSWLRDRKNGEEMKADWVFAGSQFMENPLDAKRPKVYVADREGIVMSLANFEGSVLDVSIESARLRADQSFEAFDEHIPPVGTKVSVILEPMGK